MSHRSIRSCLLTACLLAVAVGLQAAGNQVQVIPDSQLGDWWQAAPTHPNEPPPYPIAVAQSGVDGCVAVAFAVQADGSVSNERIWKSALTDTPVTKQFEQVILAAVHKWHFVPVAANVDHTPVYTYHVFSFGLTRLSPVTELVVPTDSDRQRAEQHGDALKAKCEMTDFPQQVQAMIKAAQSGTQP